MKRFFGFLHLDVSSLSQVKFELPSVTSDKSSINILLTQHEKQQSSFIDIIGFDLRFDELKQLCK